MRKGPSCDTIWRTGIDCPMLKMSWESGINVAGREGQVPPKEQGAQGVSLKYH